MKIFAVASPSGTTAATPTVRCAGGPSAVIEPGAVRLLADPPANGCLPAASS